jgi:hypothetical protein
MMSLSQLGGASNNDGVGNSVSNNRKARRRSNKLFEKAIDAYVLGGCPFCGSPPEDFARYHVGMDRLGQTIAYCGECADGRIITTLGYGVKAPDEEGTQWSLHDCAFFKLHPERQFHIREPWKQEAIILAKMTGMPDVDVSLNAVLVVRIRHGVRGRILCPFPSPKIADEAGDEAIAAQTGHSVAELLAKLHLTAVSHPNGGSMQAEKEYGLAWTRLFKDRQWQTYIPRK